MLSMNTGRCLRTVRLFALLAAWVSTFWSIAALGNDDLRAGQRYEIIGTLYAYSVAENLNTRQLSLIGLSPLGLSGPEMLSRQLIPKNGVLTIIDKVPKGFFEFLASDRYLVRVTGFDAPTGIPVMLQVCCGNEGKSTALNPEIFKPLP